MQTTLGGLGPDTAVIVPIFAEDDLSGLEEIRRAGGSAFEAALAHGGDKGKLYETTLLFNADAPTLLLIGAGDRRDFDGITRLRVAAAASRVATGRGFRRLAAIDRVAGDSGVFGHAVAEGVVRGAYHSALLKTDGEEPRRLDSLTLVASGDRIPAAEVGARVGFAVGEASTITRDLVNLPPNELTPSALAERAQELAREAGLQCEVLDERQLRELGMGSLLGVAAGSDQPPRVIVLHYGDQTAAAKLAVVGKGLTFDSGGLSLKTAEGMEWMKADMGGAGAVLGGILAVAKLGIPGISVTAYIGATENMPGGRAMRPGDVITAMNGKTIEVLNTDAEGRLVLADVLSYAVSRGERHIVDFATLTGSAMIALGRAASLAVGAPSEWVADVVRASDAGLERAWQMPLYPEYRRAMDSEIADIKNSGPRYGGALNAAAFLREFVGDANWAHMDIAGTAWTESAEPYLPIGATGVGVGQITALAQRMARG